MDPRPGEAKADAAEARKTRRRRAKDASTARKMIRIVQYRSPIACQEKQRRVLAGLGLSRPGRSVLREDTPSVRGMVAKIPHLVRLEEVES